MTTAAILVSAVRASALSAGYAICEHGSKVRDLDLVAVPWTADAIDVELLIDMICRDCSLIRRETLYPKPTFPVVKPHGRLGYILYECVRMGDDPRYVDISVMPRRLQIPPVLGAQRCA